MLQQDGKTDAAVKLSQVFVNNDRINEYIKGFSKDGMENIIKNLNDLMQSMDMSKAESSKYVKVFESIVNGLSIQNSKPFPFFYIPVPIIINNQVYPGELYVEREEDEDKNNNIYIYLIFDTPSLGKIESDIVAATA